MHNIVLGKLSKKVFLNFDFVRIIIFFKSTWIQWKRRALMKSDKRCSMMVLTRIYSQKFKIIIFNVL